MRKKTIKPTNRLIRNESYEGKPIEKQLREMKEGLVVEFQNKPEIYTARKDGVVPEYDIKTDKFDMMLAATDKLARARIAKQNEFDKAENKEGSAETGDKTAGESIQAQKTE